MKKKTKSPMTSDRVHGQVKNRQWVRGSKNSKHLFLMTIMHVAPPEFIFGRAAANRKKQGRKMIFFLFANPELSGAIKATANMTLVTEHYIKLVLNWRNMKYTEKIDDAKMKKDMLTGNADFPVPWSPEFVTLAKLDTDIIDADAKLLARLENEPNSAQNLRVAVDLLYYDLKNIGAMIQLKMDTAVPDEAIRICLAAGYTYKAITVRGPRKNRVRQTTEPGVVQVEGESEGPRMWQFSLNPYEGGEIKDLPATSGGITVYDTGKSKEEVFFRWRLVLTKGRYGDWSAWYSGITP